MIFFMRPILKFYPSPYRILIYAPAYICLSNVRPSTMFIVLYLSYSTFLDRQGKFAGVFQVVRFPNANCLGSAGLNGTCYTESECTAKGTDQVT